ncbi:MAG TPA: hypothetical protein VFK05_06395 [Polyangiaceae bacterium]|nr:hypothetical protein [Polyangiaceae bacterium]
MYFARITHSAPYAAGFVLSIALFARPADAAFAVHLEKSHEWHWHDERALHAVVVQREGHERLSLEIQLPDQVDLTEADELIWVVPIPAPSTAIKASESLGVQRLNGGSVAGEWLGRMRSMLTVMAGSQIWPCHKFPPLRLWVR